MPSANHTDDDPTGERHTQPVKTRRWECDRPGVEPTSSGLHVWGQYHSSEKVSCDEWYWNPSPDVSGYKCGARCVVRGLLLTTQPHAGFNLALWLPRVCSRSASA